MDEQKKNLPRPQPYIVPPPFVPYNKETPTQEATGSQRGNKTLLETGFIQSVNWPNEGSWRLTPLGIEFAGTTSLFPPGVIPISALEDIAAGRVLGRTGTTGPVEQLSAGAGISIAASMISSTITQYTDEMAQDAVGAMVDADSLAYTDATPLLAVKVQKSITKDSSGLRLDGDATTPGNYKFYGTNSSGTKGFYANDVAQAEAASGITPVADGTYTVGAKLTGGGVNGTITTVKGIITAIQQAT